MNSIVDCARSDTFVDQSLSKGTKIAKVDIVHVFFVEHINIGLSLARLVAELASFSFTQVKSVLHARGALFQHASWALLFESSHSIGSIGIIEGRASCDLHKTVLLHFKLDMQELSVFTIAGDFVDHGV